MLLLVIALWYCLLEPISPLEITDLHSAEECSHEQMESIYLVCAVLNRRRRPSRPQLLVFSDLRNQTVDWNRSPEHQVNITVDRRFVYYWREIEEENNLDGFAAPIAEFPSNFSTQRVRVSSSTNSDGRFSDEFTFEDGNTRRVPKTGGGVLYDGFTGNLATLLPSETVEVVQSYDNHLLLIFSNSSNYSSLLLTFPTNPVTVCDLGGTPPYTEEGKEWVRQNLRFVIQRDEKYDQRDESSTSTVILEIVPTVDDGNNTTSILDRKKLESKVITVNCGRTFPNTPSAFMVSAVTALFVSFLLYSTVVVHRLKLKKSYEQIRACGR